MTINNLFVKGQILNFLLKYTPENGATVGLPIVKAMPRLIMSTRTVISGDYEEVIFRPKKGKNGFYWDTFAYEGNIYNADEFLNQHRESINWETREYITTP
jgi:hypothetical protein